MATKWNTFSRIVEQFYIARNNGDNEKAKEYLVRARDMIPHIFPRNPNAWIDWADRAEASLTDRSIQ